MKKIFIIIIFTLTVVLSGCGFFGAIEKDKTQEEVSEEIVLPPEPQFDIKSCEVEDGDTFATILEEYGIALPRHMTLLVLGLVSHFVLLMMI
jgi:hypothetical protein